MGKATLPAWIWLPEWGGGFAPNMPLVGPLVSAEKGAFWQCVVEVAWLMPVCSWLSQFISPPDW